MHESGKKNTRTRGGYDGTHLLATFCFLFFSDRKLLQIRWHILENGRNWQAVLLLVRSADENVGGSVVDIFWKTEVIGKLYYVRPADENVGGFGGWHIWKNGRNWQAVLRAFRQRNEGGTVGVLFFVFWDSIYFVVSYGGREAELEIISGCL